MSTSIENTVRVVPLRAKFRSLTRERGHALPGRGEELHLRADGLRMARSHSLPIPDGLGADQLPFPAALSAVEQSALLLLPTDLLSIVLAQLDKCELASLAATCRLLWFDTPGLPPHPMAVPQRPMGAVEMELRRRATARGMRLIASLPEGGLCWVSYLLKRIYGDTLIQETPLAVADHLSLVADAEGGLGSWGLDNSQEAGPLLLGRAEGVDTNPDFSRFLSLPMPMPSMQGRRIVSVATGYWHCLALSREGEVYSWGEGLYGSLGHAHIGERAVPSRVESLSRIELIAAGPSSTSAAVDEDGRLFTWGRAVEFAKPSGLGYALDAQTESQLTPRKVDALLQDRVVGVSMGSGFTLALTNAGAVFSFGSSAHGSLGHGSLEPELLPRRIEALALTGRRFVAVAAGWFHGLALTGDGELYSWGDALANGLGECKHTPLQKPAFIGQRVKLVCAAHRSSCAVTEEGELYTWGGGACGQLGHGDLEAVVMPERVEGLSGFSVVAAAICRTHTLVADENGVVYAFGARTGTGLGDPCEEYVKPVVNPTQIPTLRVRTSTSAGVLPFDRRAARYARSLA